MNTKTATRNARTFISNGAKWTATETFPTPEQFAILRNHSKALPEQYDDLLAVADRILAAGAGLSMDDRNHAWAQAESDFEMSRGIRWDDLLAEFSNEIQREQSKSASRYQNILPPLTERDAVNLERIYNEAPRFRPVSKEAYNGLFKGAASSRRSGVSFDTWGQRSVAAGWPRGLVALIAFRAYSMPIAELVGYLG